MTAFGQALKDHRKSLGVSRAKMAIPLECTANTLRNWENGNRLPWYYKLGRIAEVYEIPLDELTRLYENAAKPLNRYARRCEVKNLRCRDTEVGKRIRILRERNQMTQREFAEAVGVATITVGSWERGQMQPVLKTLKRIAETYGTTLDWLMEGM